SRRFRKRQNSSRNWAPIPAWAFQEPCRSACATSRLPTRSSDTRAWHGLTAHVVSVFTNRPRIIGQQKYEDAALGLFGRAQRDAHRGRPRSGRGQSGKLPQTSLPSRHGILAEGRRSSTFQSVRDRLSI